MQQDHRSCVEQVQQEAVQLAEQETARELILKASKKLAHTLHNPQDAKVVQSLLNARNKKLSITTKQLAEINYDKEKLENNGADS